MTTTKLTKGDLRQFTGTENWYRHPLAVSVRSAPPDAAGEFPAGVRP